MPADEGHAIEFALQDPSQCRSSETLMCCSEDSTSLTLCLSQAFYNDKKKIMTDDEFDQLREDLEFSGSEVAVMNRMEVMFMVAANRY